VYRGTQRYTLVVVTDGHTDADSEAPYTWSKPWLHGNDSFSLVLDAFAASWKSMSRQTFRVYSN